MADNQQNGRARVDAQAAKCFFKRPYSVARSFSRTPFTPVVFMDLAMLLVLLFVTIEFSELVVRPGIKLQLPSTRFSDGSHFDKYDTILITLSREGMVFFNEELTNMEGLASSIARAGQQGDDTSILIQADASIDYGTIVRIFNMGDDAGIKDITLATSIAQEALLEQ